MKRVESPWEFEKNNNKKKKATKQKTIKNNLLQKSIHEELKQEPLNEMPEELQRSPRVMFNS
jgi:hypothetical protein